MKIISIILPLALVAGCKTTPKSASPRTQPPPPAVTVSGTDLDQHNTEKVRLSETLKAYPIGRFIDPADPNVMYESHTVYRKESDASWNTQPNTPTVIPLGPVLAVADPTRQPFPLPAELEHEIAEQNQLMGTLVKQNQTLFAELTRLNQEMSELRGKVQSKVNEGSK